MCYFVSACMMSLFAMRFDVNLGMRESFYTAHICCGLVALKSRLKLQHNDTKQQDSE